jgi:hypothetical protein
VKCAGYIASLRGSEQRVNKGGRVALYKAEQRRTLWPQPPTRQIRYQELKWLGANMVDPLEMSNAHNSITEMYSALRLDFPQAKILGPCHAVMWRYFFGSGSRRSNLPFSGSSLKISLRRDTTGC